MANTLNPPFEYLLLVQESSYGVPVVSPVLGTSAIYIRLAGGNRFGMYGVPTKRKVASGGGYAAAGYAVSDQWVNAGNLSLELTYSQAAFLLGWSVTTLNSGGTAPWTYAGVPGDMVSCSCYHGKMRSDGSMKIDGFLGTKVHTGKVASSEGSGLVMMDLSLRAQAKIGAAYYWGGSYYNVADPTGLSLATGQAPADSVFPTDAALFVQSGGLTTFGGATNAMLNSLDLAWDNHLDSLYFQSPFIQLDQKRGRSATCSAKVLYAATPDWQRQLETLYSGAASFGWSNGLHGFTLNYQGNCLTDSVGYDLTPGKIYTLNIGLEMQRDTTNGDITATVT